MNNNTNNDNNNNNDKNLLYHKHRYAITFGEVSILHVGGKQYGNGIKSSGFSISKLKSIKEKIGKFAEIIWISDKLPANLVNDNEACVLVIRQNEDFISKKYADELLNEQCNIDYDSQYWDNRRQKTLTKRARLNIVFGENEIDHSEDYKQCTVKSFNNIPRLQKFKSSLPTIFGSDAENLSAEGNHYHHDKSYIGFHGDTERKIVICLSLGKTSTIRFSWRMPYSSEHSVEPTDIKINHGDIYIMSEKATGFDWKKRSKVRVVHSTQINGF